HRDWQRCAPVCGSVCRQKWLCRCGCIGEKSSSLLYLMSLRPKQALTPRIAIRLSGPCGIGCLALGHAITLYPSKGVRLHNGFHLSLLYNLSAYEPGNIS